MSVLSSGNNVAIRRQTRRMHTVKKITEELTTLSTSLVDANCYDRGNMQFIHFIFDPTNSNDYSKVIIRNVKQTKVQECLQCRTNRCVHILLLFKLFNISTSAFENCSPVEIDAGNIKELYSKGFEGNLSTNHVSLDIKSNDASVEEVEYEVSRVIGMVTRQSAFHTEVFFRVLWKGFGKTDAEWVEFDANNCNFRDRIAEYFSRQELEPEISSVDQYIRCLVESDETLVTFYACCVLFRWPYIALLFINMILLLPLLQNMMNKN